MAVRSLIVQPILWASLLVSLGELVDCFSFRNAEGKGRDCGVQSLGTFSSFESASTISFMKPLYLALWRSLRSVFVYVLGRKPRSLSMPGKSMLWNYIFSPQSLLRGARPLGAKKPFHRGCV